MNMHHLQLCLNVKPTLTPQLCIFRPLQQEEEEILREALLASGTAPEAPVDSSRKRRRSWYSLLGTAVAYVWPEGTILQLRAFLCIILILIMRVLNLAVPILYKNVVDVLADTSERTHPRDGSEPEKFQFKQVRFFLHNTGRKSTSPSWPNVCSLLNCVCLVCVCVNTLKFL